ncbi:MAG: hypothetical protein OEV42_20730 [Deltaproteobacteria bacterium]|nr:hypothetical protein [Deltaproteobacteria bacterium]
MTVAVGIARQVPLGIINPAFAIAVPVGAAFRQAELLVPCGDNAVAVGVRLFADIPLTVLNEYE